MEVIVCIKQVPNPSQAKINPETGTVVREGVDKIVNPFDMYAIEEGVRIKERYGGSVTAITMGPPDSENALREALTLGVDQAVLLSDRAFAGADTLATSYSLARAIEKIGRYDLIICGKQAIDGDTAQVGPELAENLDLPHVTEVRKIVELSDGSMTVEKLIEDGFEVIRVRLPALITVVKEINEPRLPSLKGMMRAKKASIPTWTAGDIGADAARIGSAGSPTRVHKTFEPKRASRSEMLEGSVQEQVKSLVDRIRTLGIV